MDGTPEPTEALTTNARLSIIIDVTNHSQENIDMMMRKFCVDWGMIAHLVEEAN